MKDLQQLKDICSEALYDAIHEGKKWCTVVYDGQIYTFFDDGTVCGPAELQGLWQEVEHEMAEEWLEQEQLLEAGL